MDDYDEASPSREAMSVEIFGMILKEVSHAGFLRLELRLVSKKFDAMVLPLTYNHVTLTSKNHLLHLAQIHALEREDDLLRIRGLSNHDLVQLDDGFGQMTKKQYEEHLYAISRRVFPFCEYHRRSIFDLDELKGLHLGSYVNRRVKGAIATVHKIMKFTEVLTIDRSFIK